MAGCTCDTNKLCLYNQGTGDHETISFTKNYCNSSLNPTLKAGECVDVGDALFYDAGELTTIYAPGLKFAGISDSCLDDKDGTGLKTPTVHAINSEVQFSACFEDGFAEADIQVGSYYSFVAGDKENTIDSTSVSPVDTGHQILLKEVLGGCGCCTRGVFTTCC